MLFELFFYFINVGLIFTIVNRNESVCFLHFSFCIDFMKFMFNLFRKIFGMNQSALLLFHYIQCRRGFMENLMIIYILRKIRTLCDILITLYAYFYIMLSKLTNKPNIYIHIELNHKP